jgi:type IV pilus assembly protein PilC
MPANLHTDPHGEKCSLHLQAQRWKMAGQRDEWLMTQATAQDKNFNVPGARNIRATKLPFFSRSLGATLDTGMVLSTCLKSLETQERNPHFKALISWLRMDVEKGSTLSESMRQFPSVFDVTYISMIKAAETTGKMPETLKELAECLEAAETVRKKVRSAMIYPISVLSIAFVVGAFVVTFIIPQFKELYGSMGSQLPAPTRLLLRVSDVARSSGILILLAIGMLAATPSLLRRSPAGRLLLDRLILALPVFGRLSQKLASARFARTLGSLVRSGVPVLSALDVSAGATGNTVIAAAIRKARASVEQGDPLSQGLATQRVIPPMLVDMLRTGEKTGRIDEMLYSIARFYEEETNTMLTGLTALLQPILILIVGAIVGALVLGALMPILQAPGIIQ